MIASTVDLFRRYGRRFAGGDGVVGRTMRASAHASAWVTAATASLSILRLVSNLILARLVAPEAFGIIGIAMSITTAIGLLSDIGLAANVVRSERGEEPAFLHTVYVVKLARAALMALVLFAAALVIGVQRDSFPDDSIYAIPATAWVIAAIGIQTIVNGATSPTPLLAQRKLRQKPLAIMNVGARLVDLPITIFLAWLGFGVWALVAGMMVNAAIKVVVTHLVLEGPRMKLAFEREAFREIFHFGKWLLIASGAQVLVLRGDQFIFSGAFSARDFSLYVTAFTWVSVFENLVSGLIAKTGFSAISAAMRENRAALVGVYKRFRLLTDAFMACGFVGLLLFHQPFFRLIYPPAFEPAADWVPFIAIILLFVPYDLLGRVVIAAGDSRNFSFVKIVRAVTLVTVVPLTLHHAGPKAAALAVGLAASVEAAGHLYFARRHMKLDLLTEIRMPVMIVLASVVVLTLFR